MSSLVVLRRACVTAAADMGTLYTWRTWLLGWFARMVAQVTFFAFAGELYGGAAGKAYAFVGAALMACVIEAMMAVASTVWEKLEGTLPLLLAAPGSLYPVFLGRSTQWLASGVLTSSLILAGGRAFGVPVTPAAWAACVGLIALTAVGTYFVALTLGFVVLHFPGARNIVSNVAYMFMILVCGVVTPVAAGAAPLQVAAQAFPLTHGLAATRTVLAGSGPPWSDVLLLALTLLAWAAVSVLTLRVVVRLARERGTAAKLL